MPASAGIFYVCAPSGRDVYAPSPSPEQACGSPMRSAPSAEQCGSPRERSAALRGMQPGGVRPVQDNVRRRKPNNINDFPGTIGTNARSLNSSVSRVTFGEKLTETS
jgi:hypothetical protein